MSKAIDLNDWLTPAEATEIMRKQDQLILSIKQEVETALVIGDAIGMRDGLQEILRQCDEHLGITT